MRAADQPTIGPMTRMARTERDALCDLALQLGESEPTLCGDWSVKDLVVHLLVRERSPAAAGITAAAPSSLRLLSLFAPVSVS